MRATPGRCAIDDDIASVIFGVDGVIVDSAPAAATAWKSVLDPFLRTHCAMREETFAPFDVRSDYLHHIHGRARTAGVHDFLASRGVRLCYDAVRGLTACQEEFFLAEVRRHGVTPFRSSVAMIREARRHGLRTAAVSAERHRTEILRQAGVMGLLDLALDGFDAPRSVVPAQVGWALLQQAAARMGTPPAHTAVVTESAAGVTAASRGGFGMVVGVDRFGDADTLRERGATVVVTDLSEIRLTGRRARPPAAREALAAETAEPAPYAASRRVRQVR